MAVWRSSTSIITTETGHRRFFTSVTTSILCPYTGTRASPIPTSSGFSDERAGKGFNRNFPLYPGTDDDAYVKTLEEALGVLRRFKPDFFVVSLGLDIMAGDPTGAFSITTKGVQRIGRLVGSLKVPMLIVQEGGYTLRNLHTGATAFFSGILSWTVLAQCFAVIAYEKHRGR